MRKKSVPSVRLDPKKWVDKRKTFDGKVYTLSSWSNTKPLAVSKARRVRLSGKLARVVYHGGADKWLVYRRRKK